MPAIVGFMVGGILDGSFMAGLSPDGYVSGIEQVL